MKKCEVVIKISGIAKIRLLTRLCSESQRVAFAIKIRTHFVK